MLWHHTASIYDSLPVIYLLLVPIVCGASDSAPRYLFSRKVQIVQVNSVRSSSFFVISYNLEFHANSPSQSLQFWKFNVLLKHFLLAKTNQTSFNEFISRQRERQRERDVKHSLIDWLLDIKNKNTPQEGRWLKTVTKKSFLFLYLLVKVACAGLGLRLLNVCISVT